MSKITFPPLPERAGYAPALKGDIYTAEQMQERDRQIAEHVIRACAAIAETFWNPGPIPDAILALLEEPQA